MTTQAFVRQLAITAQITRPGAGSGAASVIHAAIKCAPIDPFVPTVASRDEVSGPSELLQTFAEAQGIQVGDYLIPTSGKYAGKKLPIVSVGEWEGVNGFVHLKMKEIKS
ncbi:MAG TPA: hypothetical protein PL074_00275 [Thermoflexales bacterium]|nr:hypothetical protein [Thermoflexales bacterium]HQX74712.1 hypothetical protein [Thermoflexales bacterium]